MIFFHTHEGGILICLGIAAAFPADMKLLGVFFELGKDLLQSFNGTLKGCFSFPAAMNKDDVMLFLERIELLA